MTAQRQLQLATWGAVVSLVVGIGTAAMVFITIGRRDAAIDQKVDQAVYNSQAGGFVKREELNAALAPIVQDVSVMKTDLGQIKGDLRVLVCATRRACPITNGVP